MKEFVRRINFFTASFLGILGISLIGEIFSEDDVPDKIDDILFLLLGLVAIWWYKKSGYQASTITKSLLLLALGVIIKFGAIVVEHADAEAVGDDIGILIATVIALIFVGWLSTQVKKLK